ncbi:unnamed protein product [Meloidogyne enterolobii]|uniref:Uncharacterized protein n=1 Tax=Meloidogyne enterolobii TaxID=390850 RepID=A0ACB0ZGR6_MELEN
MLRVRVNSLLVILLAIWTSLNCVMSDVDVGYGRHPLVRNKIKSLNEARHIAKNNEDLQDYKGTENSCDVKFDENGDIVLNYNTVRETGCAIDLIEKFDFMFGFKGILSNDNKKIRECLQPMPDGFNANMVPFAYSIGFERFEELKEGPYDGDDISCHKKDECIKSGGECLRPGGLEFGWAYDGDKVHASMQSVGEPVVCQCTLKDDHVNNLKSEIDVHVDDGLFWFHIENFERNCYSSSRCDFVCLWRLDMIVEEEGLIKPIAWRLNNRIYEDFAFNKLLVFYLLPQKASFQRDGNNIKRNSPLDGPNCKIEIKFGTKTEEIETTTKEGTAKETWSAPTSKLSPTSTSLQPSIRPKPSPTSKSNIFVTVALIAVNVILFVIIVSGLCWFCFCREEGNNEEKK